MPEASRAQRNLCDDIVTANRQVQWWRQEGNCDKLVHWTRRRDQLLDRLIELRKAPPHENCVSRELSG